MSGAGYGKYRSFAELCASEREDHDWRRVIAERASPALVLAPHGGSIEAGTSEIAREVAGRDASLYCFEGIRRHGNRGLHIASSRFDDPFCLALLARARQVVAIHGCNGEIPFVAPGGLDLALRGRLAAALEAAGFPVVPPAAHHAGTNPRNVCNRGAAGRGAQLELSRGLRRTLFVGLGHWDRRWTTPALPAFAAAVRAALRDCEPKMPSEAADP